VITDWNDGKVLNHISTAIEEASKEGAELIAKEARRIVRKKSGVLHDAIEARPSEFKDGGYVVGIFEQTPVPARWEDSLGARGVFLEYGHAAPGKGIGTTMKFLGLKRTRKSVTKTVKPYPFLRPAMKKYKRKIQQIYKDKIG